MKILVTGGAGFIGFNLVTKLKSEGHNVKVLDTSKDRSKNPFGSVCIKEFSSHDWLDFGQTEPYDIIYHLAAYVSASESVEEPEECYNVNVGGTLNILNKFKYNRIIFASSAAVYGDVWIGSEFIPDDFKRPQLNEKVDTSKIDKLLTPYAKSKLIGEDLVKGMSDSWACLRFFNVYGENQNPAYGAVIQKFLENYKNGDPYTIYGDGEQVRDFVHVDDVVDALTKVGFRDEVGAFNVGTGIGTTVNQLQKLVDFDGEVEYKEGRNGDPSYSVADITSIGEVTRWVPQIKLSEGINKLKK